jgi:lipoate-protein ligase A
MLFIENNNRDPYQNHGLEEWLMDEMNEDCFMLWHNEKAILLGRNQNYYNEINIAYAKEHNIKIVRRITGGGTVFTDEGNLMFTFISCEGKKDFTDFKKFTKPILNALQRLGVPAVFSGRNDLTIDGKKISGNAQCRYKDKVLHHGTLMFDANTEELAQALNVKEIKLKGKGVSSVKSHVANISNYLNEKMSIEQFRQCLLQMIMEEVDDAIEFKLSEMQWQEVRERTYKKHGTKEWIYGFQPNFKFHKETKFLGGIVEVFLDIRRNKVADIKIYGDFFSDGDINEIEDEMRGVEYEEQAVRNVLNNFSVKKYFGQITRDELVTAII